MIIGIIKAPKTIVLIKITLKIVALLKIIT